MLQSEVHIERRGEGVSHQGTVESLVELQLLDKARVWLRLRSEPGDQVQTVTERGDVTGVKEPGEDHRDAPADSVPGKQRSERGQLKARDLQWTRTRSPASAEQSPTKISKYNSLGSGNTFYELDSSVQM